MTLNSPRSSARWTALAMAVAASLPLLVAVPGSAEAAAPVTCGSNGATYGIDSAGKLMRQDMPSPISGNTLPAATTIDTGWTGYGKLMAGPGATFYGIKSDGLYYSHRITASSTWDVHHKKLTTGFAQFRTGDKADDVTIDRGGYLWAFETETGALRWWHYSVSGDDVTATGGKIVDMGWDRYEAIYAGDKGVLFGRAADGKIYRSRYDVTSQRWLERHVLVSSADWTDTKSMSTYGADTLFRVKGNGEVRYYRYDEDTHDFPVYNKLVANAGWANTYTTVSTAPDICRIDTDHTPASPAVGLQPYSRGAVLKSSAGGLAYAYTDNLGYIRYGRQDDPSDFNGVKWETISGNEAAYSGEPSLAEHTDGRIVVTALNTAGSVAQRNQAAKGSADWGGWIDLAGAMAQPAVTAKTPSGLLVQFSVDANGAPWYRLQQRANVDFMGWTPLSGTGISGQLTAVTVRDGVQLFSKNASGVLSTALFKEPGTISSWTALGTQTITGTPAVVVYPGYRLRVFATDQTGTVVTTVQATEGAAYDAWTTVAGVTAKGSPAAVISPLNGITEVVVRGADDTIYHTGETVQGSGTWRAWRQESAEFSATEPNVFTFTDSSGPTWAYSFRTADNQTRLYSVRPDFALKRAEASGAPKQSEAPAFTAHSLPAPPTN
ncbi:tachylectin-related carbohydrate-binding protein [Streptomyces sp. NPDC059568]|uniref:tachylectin-related carbohydrate-binding protein n=1 Tax=Streptomyces sp. NPDC059568 TaxID=3346868 RepID=UPI003683F7BC